MASELSRPFVPALLLAVLATGTLATGCSRLVTHKAEHPQASPTLSTEVATSASSLSPDHPYPLGPFDVSDADFTPRNVCVDITTEMADELGLGRRLEGGDASLGDSHHSCGFLPGEPFNSPLITIISDNSIMSELVQVNQIHKNPHPSEINGVFTYFHNIPDPTTCFASVYTKQGRLTIGYGGPQSFGPKEHLCNDARDYLEKLYKKLGENK